MATSGARFGRVRYPKIQLQIVTEHSEYHVTCDYSKNSKSLPSLSTSALTNSVVSFKTTNDIGDDSATFSIMLAGNTLWDRVINANDIISLWVDPMEVEAGYKSKRTNIMTGMVSEVRIEGAFDSDTKMYQITGQSMAKLFSQYKIGMVSAVEQQLSGMGWLWDSGMDLKEAYGTSASDAGEDSSDDSSGGSSGAWTTKGTVAYKNAKAIFESWTAHGFSGAAAAGILGNIAHEGGFDIVDRAEGHYGASEKKNGIAYGVRPIPSGSGYSVGGAGIYQITPYTKFAAIGSKDWLSASKQTNFAWKSEISKYLDRCPYNVGGKGVGSYKAYAKLSDPVRAAKAFFAMYERGAAYNSAKSSSATKAYELFNGSSIKADTGKLGGSGSGSSSSSSSGSSSSSSSDGSSTTIEAIERETSNSVGMAMYGNTVAQMEHNIIERFKPYIKYTYNNGKNVVFDYIDYDSPGNPFTSWDMEILRDSSSFSNFTGSLYELQKAALRAPFNEMFYESENGKSRLIVRRTPFNPVDWASLDETTVDSTAVLNEDIGKSDREQYSVFIVNPASGLLKLAQDSMSFGSYPKTNRRLIDKYGYSKMEVDDLYVSGVYDDDMSKNHDLLDAKKSTSKNASKGKHYTLAMVNSYFKSVNSNKMRLNKSKYAKTLADRANNISMVQGNSLVNAYISNAYKPLSQNQWNSYMDTELGGGTSNTGTHSFSYKKVKSIAKEHKNHEQDFVKAMMAYFKNCSYELAVSFWSEGYDGKLSEKTYNKIIKDSKSKGQSNNSGKVSAGTLLDTDYFQNILYNWYANNFNWWSGTYTIIGNPEIKLGTRLLFKDNMLAAQDGYPGKRFYIESVSHNFSFNEGYTTEIGVTRGLVASGSGSSDIRFSQQYLWGTAESYRGGYMGEATADLLATTVEASSSSSDSDVSGSKSSNAIVADAQSYIKGNYSKPEIYALGGYGERGSTNPLTHDINGGKLILDCSSFVYWLLKKHGITTGQVTNTQAADTKNFRRVNIASGTTNGMKEGDLVFLYNCGHVMLYAGGGNLIGWNGGGAGTNASYDPTGGCKQVSLSAMGGRHDGYVMRLKG